MHAHIFERVWLIIGALMLLLFLVLVSLSGFVYGKHLPGEVEQIDPKLVRQDSRFAAPKVEQVAPGRFQVNVLTQIFSFSPPVIEVPRGAEVTFVVTSADVIHGFEIAGTNVNQMVIPGYINNIKARFDKPGEYLIICNEYCGTGHQAMQGKLIVR